MHPRFLHMAYFYVDEGKRFLKSNLYLSAKCCGFLFEKNYEVTVKLRLYAVQRSLHTLGPLWFLILVRPQSQFNKMLSIILITMKQATPSKKECVLFPFQTQLQSLLYNPTYNKHNNMHGTTVKKKKTPLRGLQYQYQHEGIVSYNYSYVSWFRQLSTSLCGGKRGTTKGFSLNISIFSCQHHAINAPHLYSIHLP